MPDGPVGQKPFALIRQTLIEAKLHGVARVVMSGKEQLVLVRPMDRLLAMTILNYANRIKQSAAFNDEVTDVALDADELKLMAMLTKGMTAKKFDLAAYHDEYTEKLTKLIEAKVEGKELVSPPATEEPQVINLMDALKKSVARFQAEEPQTAKAPPRKMAASKGKRAAPKAAPAKKKGRKIG